VPVTVALVPDLESNGTAALIRRRPNALPHDLILLSRATANGERLALAVAYLRTLRKLGGDTAAAVGTFRVREDRMRMSVVHGIRPHTDGVVSRLRGSAMRDVPGVGRVRARDIFLLPEGP
jgi:hypothetical protein